MTKNNNQQKAGKNSKQFQIEKVILGIDEKRAREICNEIFEIQKKDLIEESKIIASERVLKFEEKFLPHFKDLKLLEQLKRPEFLNLISLAEKSASETDNENDYDLLINLLINKTQIDNNRKTGTGIKEALKIVNEIDADSLLCLSVLSIYNCISIKTNSISELLKIFDELFSYLPIDRLPKEFDWLDQLYILKCIRYSETKKFLPLEEVFMRGYNGFFVHGIKKDSDDYLKALQLLKEGGFSSNIFVENELLEGFYKLNIGNRLEITDDLKFVNSLGTFDLAENQRKILIKILELYDKKTEYDKQMKDNLINLIKLKKNLYLIREWLLSFKGYIELTSVGKVLGYTNAKILNPKLPSLF